jgi:Na+-translocating ferredoxin:NAD+ oxidoreductase RnfG subunit
MSTVIKEITPEELQELIEKAVWKALRQVLNDPDYGLELRDEVIQRLEKSSNLTEDDLMSAENVAADLDLKW